MNVAVAPVTARAEQFMADPASFFRHDYTTMQSVPRAELEELQLAAMQLRLDDLRGRVPMLQKLADGQSITRLDRMNDIVPLLFEHTMYKAYPAALLEKGRFAEINKFISKLCVFDLTTIDVSGCETIDQWMETMDRESELYLMHSSGTSGTMSFLPTAKTDWHKFGRTLKVTLLQRFGETTHDDEPFHAIYPYFRHGGASHVRMCEIYAHHIASEERLHCAYPGRMSSDLLYLGSKLRAAAIRGDMSKVKISPALLARRAELEQLQAEMPQHLLDFFARLAEQLKGKRVFFWGAQNLLFNVAKIGTERDVTGVFKANSIVGTGGDVKDGVVMPDDWREQVCKFMGIDEIRVCYGMSEIGGLHNRCSHGHYHFAPWVVPFVLDPDTSKPLERSGRTTGRAGFMDLGAEGRWGGFITGDEITIEWDQPCGCGASTVWAEDTIQRLSAKRGGDDKINCAATEGAHREAMDFLNSLA